MLPGWTEIAVEPLAALPPGEELAVAGAFSLLLQDPEAFVIFLLEATPGNGPAPPADVVRLSDRGFVTEPGDTPADTPYSPRLLEALNYEVAVPAPDEGESLGRFGIGVVEIANDDMELDDFLDRFWEGRPVDLLAGGTLDVGLVTERTLTFDEYELALRGTVDGISAESGRLRLRFRDAMAKLDIPLQTNRYAGTGGAEGGDAISGLVKPLCYGEPKNVSPVLIDDVNLVYQIHDGAIQAVDAVRDNGSALTATSDFADYTALIGATLSVGEYATALAVGMIRVGASPAGQITVDAQGDNTGGYVSSTPDVARRIASAQGGLADPAEFDGLSFGSFLPTDAIGFYVDTEITVLATLQGILVAADGWLTSTRDGRLRIGRYRDPDTASAIAEVTDDRLHSVVDDVSLPPAFRVLVRYRRHWTVQDADGLAAGLSAADRQRYSTEYRTARQSDLAVRTDHPNARVFRLNTLFVTKTPADTLASELLTRLKKRRRRYRLDIDRVLLQRRPGDVIKVTSKEGDLDTGRQVYVYQVAEVGSNRTNLLEAWG